MTFSHWHEDYNDDNFINVRSLPHLTASLWQILGSLKINVQRVKVVPQEEHTQGSYLDLWKWGLDPEPCAVERCTQALLQPAGLLSSPWALEFPAQLALSFPSRA